MVIGFTYYTKKRFDSCQNFNMIRTGYILYKIIIKVYIYLFIAFYKTNAI